MWRTIATGCDPRSPTMRGRELLFACHPWRSSGCLATRSLSTTTPMSIVSWLNLVKRLRSAFRPKENRENPSYDRYLYSLNKSARRNRSHSDKKYPRLSARKSVLAIERDAPPFATTKWPRPSEYGTKTDCDFAPMLIDS